MANVHFILQAKGGVGKSVISCLIAQYLNSKGRNVVPIDTDPSNKSLYAFKELKAKTVEILNGLQIDQKQFDDVVEIICGKGVDDAIVDTGASSFLEFTHYMVDNAIINLLQSMGHTAHVHTVITGEDLKDTMIGFTKIAELFSDAKLHVWLNGGKGDIERDGKSFEQMKAYKDNQNAVNSIIKLEQYGTVKRKQFEAMLEARKTFNEALASPELKIAEKSRLFQMQMDIFQALDLAMLYEDNKEKESA